MSNATSLVPEPASVDLPTESVPADAFLRLMAAHHPKIIDVGGVQLRGLRFLKVELSFVIRLPEKNQRVMTVYDLDDDSSPLAKHFQQMEEGLRWEGTAANLIGTILCPCAETAP